MKKSTDELLSRLLHIGDAPSIAPDRDAELRAADRSVLQASSRPRRDSRSPASGEVPKPEKFERLPTALLGSLMAFAAISVISIAEGMQARVGRVRRRLRDALKVVIVYAKTSAITTLKPLLLRRVSALIHWYRREKK